jgi:HK97 gp10 family phage protein
MDLVGDVALQYRMKQLPQKLQKKHGRRAVKKSARRVVKAAKARAPVGRTGLLKKSLGYKPRTYKSNVLAIVGPRTKFRMADSPYGGPHNPAVIAHLIEMGHGGPHPAAPHPFVRPAWDSTKSECQRIIAAELTKGLEQEAKA